MARKIDVSRPESWVEARIDGIVDRKRFTTALKLAVVDFLPALYGHATEEIYKGLWERTTRILKRDLNIGDKQNPRDHMSEYALIYIRLTERTCADLLNDAGEVSYAEAIEIVQTVARLFHEQAATTSRVLGIDLVTEKPLLPPSK